MSVTDKKLTFEFVENYKRKNPEVKRPDLRKMIRLELGITKNKTKLRRLDDYLRTIFDTERQHLKIIEELKNKVNDLEKYEWVASYLHLSELLENERDYKMLYDLIEKLERIKNQESWEEQQKFYAEISRENES